MIYKLDSLKVLQLFTSRRLDSYHRVSSTDGEFAHTTYRNLIINFCRDWIILESELDKIYRIPEIYTLSNWRASERTLHMFLSTLQKRGVLDWVLNQGARKHYRVNKKYLTTTLQLLDPNTPQVQKPCDLESSLASIKDTKYYKSCKDTLIEMSELQKISKHSPWVTLEDLTRGKNINYFYLVRVLSVLNKLNLIRKSKVHERGRVAIAYQVVEGISRDPVVQEENQARKDLKSFFLDYQLKLKTRLFELSEESKQITTKLSILDEMYKELQDD